jgi:hypothetical protein
VEFRERPGLWRGVFGSPGRGNIILGRLNKVFIIGCIIADYFSGLFN